MVDRLRLSGRNDTWKFLFFLHESRGLLDVDDDISLTTSSSAEFGGSEAYEVSDGDLSLCKLALFPRSRKVPVSSV